MYHSTHLAKETNKQTITNQEFMLLNKKKKIPFTSHLSI